MSANDVSQLIRKWRHERRLSQGELADRIGTSPATLSKYERGWRRFELYTLEKIATALGCKLKISFEPLHRKRSSVSASSVVAQIARLFWDKQLKKDDLSKHPRWVVERVLEYGSLDDVHALISFMGKRRFMRIVTQCRFQSVKTKSFWEGMLKREKIPCMKRSYQRTPWLS